MEQCRNCGSPDLRNLGFIGTLAPSSQRVFRAEQIVRKSASPRKRAIQTLTRLVQPIVERIHPPAVAVELQSCLTCSFVQTRFPLSDPDIGRLYADYRSDSYNRERSHYEPNYADVANKVGTYTENGMTEALTAWLASRTKLDGTAILDYGGADGKFLPDLPCQKFVLRSHIEPAPGRRTHCRRIRAPVLQLRPALPCPRTRHSAPPDGASGSIIREALGRAISSSKFHRTSIPVFSSSFRQDRQTSISRFTNTSISTAPKRFKVTGSHGTRSDRTRYHSSGESGCEAIFHPRPCKAYRGLVLPATRLHPILYPDGLPARHRLQAPGRPAPRHRELVSGLAAGEKHQVLLGVTGSGKTFTMAKVIERAQPPRPHPRAQQDPRRPALPRVQAVLPQQRRRVLRLLLRLLPARSLHPRRRPLHRKGSHHQRRARQAPPLRHPLSLRTPRRHHRLLRLLHLRPRLARSLLRHAPAARKRPEASSAKTSPAASSKSSTSATTSTSAAAPSASAATSSRSSPPTTKTPTASSSSATRSTPSRRSIRSSAPSARNTRACPSTPSPTTSFSPSARPPPSTPSSPSSPSGKRSSKKKAASSSPSASTSAPASTSR